MKLKTQMKKTAGILLLGCLGLLIVPAMAQDVPRSPNGIAQPVDDTVKVIVIDDRIIVSNAPANSKMEIYNIVGTKVKEIEIRQSSGEYVLSLPKGYYIVRIAETVRKIVLR
jgi:hypothetical protein